MPHFRLAINGRRLRSEIDEFHRAPDCHVALDVEGPNFRSAQVRLAYEDSVLLHSSQTVFRQVCMSLSGSPARLWADELRGYSEVSSSLGTPPMGCEFLTTEQNLIKACLLAYMWIENATISPHDARWQEELLDQPILSPAQSAHPPIPYVYFLPLRFQPPAVPESQFSRLYALAILARLAITVDDNAPIIRFFKPLVVPGPRRDLFDDDNPNGGVNYRMWREIIRVMDSRLRELFPARS